MLYKYQKTRQLNNPREFLKGFDGIVVTDGYQVYHKLETKEELTVAGCWSHYHRGFSDSVKAIDDKKVAKSAISLHVLTRITTIYKEDKSCTGFYHP